jgi:hypothetical protein
MRSGKIIQFLYGGHGLNPQHLVRGLLGLAPRESLPFDAYELYRQHVGHAGPSPLLIFFPQAILAGPPSDTTYSAPQLHNLTSAVVRVCEEATWLDEQKVGGGIAAPIAPCLSLL